MSHVLTKARVRPISRFRTEIIFSLILLALAIVSWLPRLSGPIDLRWDGSVYYILGTSLAEGKGYRLLNEPGEIEAVQYPPLLPLIVAAHQWVLGTSDPIIVGQWLRLSFSLVFILYVLAIYLMVRNYLPLKYAFLATLVCLFSFFTHFMSDLLFPDIMYGLATILFILCNRKSSRRVYPILAALSAVTAYALRATGIALLAAWVAESLFKKEFKRAAVRLALALLTILCWQSYIYSVESGTQYNNPAYEYQRADYMFYNVSYARNIFRLKDSFSPESGHASFKDITHRFLRNLVMIPTFLGETVSSTKRIWELPWKVFNMPFPLATPWPVYLVLITLGCLILGGICIQLARRQWVIPLYILLSLAVICLTPWPGQFNRYLVPLAPFLALSLFKILLAIKDQSYKRLPARWKAADLVFTGSIVSMILILQSLTLFLVYAKWHQEVIYNDRNGKKIVYHLFFYHDPHRALDAGLDWLRLQAKPDDIVALSMPHWAYLRTGLKAVMPPFEPNPVKAQNLLDSVPVRYLILDQGLAVDSRRYTSPVVQNFPNLWRRVYSDSVVTESGEELKDRFQIYQRVDPQISSRKRNSTAYP